jgi:S-adenosylmethionine hydrolase
MQPTGIITLTTDFGLTDSYVGIMKGVILGIAPTARLIDITHTISPQDVQQAAYMVQTYARYFPTGTVHMVVVDPGVGSARRAIAFETPESVVVGPDNGVLTAAWQDARARWQPDVVQAVELADPRYWLPDVSNTFHGRDIFAPVAAHLARGTPLAALGPSIADVHEATLTQPTRDAEGTLQGRIVHIDYFGNCITNIMPQHLEQLGDHVTVRIGGARIQGVRHTFADVAVGELLALIGSTNHLEIGIRNGNAARTLGVTTTDPVRITAERQK